GRIYDPRVVDLFLARGDHFLAGLDDASTWDDVQAMEPGSRAPLSGEGVGEACLAMADFADLKSPYTAGHSRRVAELAIEAARRCALPAGDVADLGRAAMLHDIGRVGISARIWLKPGPLTDSEREQVRLHPYY